MSKPPKKAEAASVTAGVHELAQRKRDNIVRQKRTRHAEGDQKAPEGYDEASRQLEEYLHMHRKKLTPERVFTLKKIYECQTPVDIQTLHRMVCEEEGLVSLTTIYNNLSLLCEIQLVRKLDLLGGKMAFFEKTIGLEPHGYVICDTCGTIRLLDNPALFELEHQLPRGFQVRDVTFHLHGTCQKCLQARRKLNRRNNKPGVKDTTASKR